MPVITTLANLSSKGFNGSAQAQTPTGQYYASVINPVGYTTSLITAYLSSKLMSNNTNIYVVGAVRGTTSTYAAPYATEFNEDGTQSVFDFCYMESFANGGGKRHKVSAVAENTDNGDRYFISGTTSDTGTAQISIYKYNSSGSFVQNKYFTKTISPSIPAGNNNYGYVMDARYSNGYLYVYFCPYYTVDVVKIDVSTMTVAWHKQITPPYTFYNYGTISENYKMTMDSSDNVYIIHSDGDSSGIGPTGIASYYVYIDKLDVNGNHIWSSCYLLPYSPPAIDTDPPVGSNKNNIMFKNDLLYVNNASYLIILDPINANEIFFQTFQPIISGNIITGSMPGCFNYDQSKLILVYKYGGSPLYDQSVLAIDLTDLNYSSYNTNYKLRFDNTSNTPDLTFASVNNYVFAYNQTLLTTTSTTIPQGGGAVLKFPLTFDLYTDQIVQNTLNGTTYSSHILLSYDSIQFNRYARVSSTITSTPTITDVTMTTGSYSNPGYTSYTISNYPI